MLKAHYSRFLAANPGRLHFAAHSHHLWPDVTRQAVLDCWDDAARLVARKWDEAVFSRVVPAAQRHVARLLGTSRPEGIAFAPSTHDLVVRLVSCFDPRGSLRVLTTDGEFMSFDRQIRRLEEEPGVEVTRVAVEPFASFERRFREACAAGGHDLVYLSHVFYESGFGVGDLAGIVAALASRETLLVVDGYHAFAAWPLDLRPLEDRVFYFWGATFDPTALYRFNAVMGWLQGLGVEPAAVLQHVCALQRRFLAGLEERRVARLPAASLVTPPDLERQGHFLAFAPPDATGLAGSLRKAGVDVDVRGDRIRFGFAVYHEASDVDELVGRLAALG